jgi:hypothetical protein
MSTFWSLQVVVVVVALVMAAVAAVLADFVHLIIMKHLAVGAQVNHN